MNNKHDEKVLFYSCLYCGAQKGEPCKTATGKRASFVHCARNSVNGASPGQLYWHRPRNKGEGLKDQTSSGKTT